jgi:predicted transcriptional regulator
MARARKFPIFVQFWTSPEQMAGFDHLASNSLLTKSDLMRQAFDEFLRRESAMRQMSDEVAA